MDRVIPVIISFLTYSLIAWIFTKLFTPPSNLTLKEKKDFFGQHLSILHAYTAIILTSAVYIYEGGIHYSESTNQVHIYVLSVIIK